MVELKIIIGLYEKKNLSVIEVSIELATNGKKIIEKVGKKKVKLKMMNNEYYELIAY